MFTLSHLLSPTIQLPRKAEVFGLLCLEMMYPNHQGT